MIKRILFGIKVCRMQGHLRFYGWCPIVTNGKRICQRLLDRSRRVWYLQARTHYQSWIVVERRWFTKIMVDRESHFLESVLIALHFVYELWDLNVYFWREWVLRRSVRFYWQELGFTILINIYVPIYSSVISGSDGICGLWFGQIAKKLE